MPTRNLKDSITTSEKIGKLSFFEEVLFYRLITVVDGNGVYPADPDYIKENVFKNRPRVTRDSILRAVQVLTTVKLATLYNVSGKQYMRLSGFDQHQRIGRSSARFPTPQPATGENDAKNDAKNDCAPTAHLLRTCCAEEKKEKEEERTKEEVKEKKEFCQSVSYLNYIFARARGKKANDEGKERFADAIRAEMTRVWGVSPSPYDIISITSWAIVIAEMRNDGTCLGSDDDIALLSAALESARNAGKSNLSYLRGIYRNYELQSITTQEELWDEDIKRREFK